MMNTTLHHHYFQGYCMMANDVLVNHVDCLSDFNVHKPPLLVGWEVAGGLIGEGTEGSK